jgi:hypothetical protein
VLYDQQSISWDSGFVYNLFVSEFVLPVFFKRVWPVVRQVVALIHALSFSCTAFHADLFMKDAVVFPELMSCTALS